MARQPENKDERIAREWLKQQGYTNIEWPDEDPPDFVVDGRYAVEVRRMDPVIEIDGKIKGEEELQIPLLRAVKKVLDSFGPPVNGKGFFVDGVYDYSQLQLPQSEALEQEIKEALQPFRDEVLKPDQNPSLLPGRLELECGICLNLRRGCPKSSMFALWHVSDGKGRRVSGEVGKSLQHCIDEKCAKASRKEKDHPGHEWWLLLVDRVLGISVQSLSEPELESLHKEIQVHKPFSRVFVISPENLEWFHEFSRTWKSVKKLGR